MVPHSHMFFSLVFTNKLIYWSFYFSLKTAKSHPPPLRAAVAPAQWTMIGFPRLENEDSHGIPMEQHRGEIESTTVNYNTHTLETSSHAFIQARIRNANYSRKKKTECGQHRVVHCSRWDWGAECWVVVWCNIKTFTAFTTPNSSLLPVQSLINPQKWNIARDCCFCVFLKWTISATEMRVTDTSSCQIFFWHSISFVCLTLLKTKVVYLKWLFLQEHLTIMEPFHC